MEIAKDKNSDFKNIASVILDSYKARVQIAESIIEDTNSVLSTFSTKREAMSSMLKGALAKVASLRKKDFDKTMEEIIERQIQKEEYIKQMLEDFIGGEKNIVNGLEKLLGKGNGIQIRDFKNMLRKMKHDQENRVVETGNRVSGELLKMQSEASVMLESFRKLRKGMASEWQKVTTILNEVPKK